MDKKNIKKVPLRALQFTEHNLVELLQKEKPDTPITERAANLRAYSGGVIDNWFWGKLVINTAGVKFQQDKKKFPLLRDHDTNRPVGFSGKPTIKDGALVIDKENSQLIRSKDAEDFVQQSDDGFPFEASISIRPTKVTRFEEPSTVTLNGRTFKDVDVVFDECMYRETSVCVFGADSHTSSEAFAENGELEIEETVVNLSGATGTEGSEQLTDADNNPLTGKEGERIMPEDKKILTLVQFQEEHPELFIQFKAELLAQARAEVKPQLDAAEARNTELAEAIKDFGTRISTLEQTNLKLSTDNAEFAKTQRKDKVKSIWDAQLDASDLPETMWPKVRMLVQDEKFNAEDGTLDEAAFTAAVVAEIGDWVSRGINKSSVQGFSSSTAGEKRPLNAGEEQPLDAKTVDETAARMASFLNKNTLKQQSA